MMTDTDDRQHRSILQRTVHWVMLERGLVPEFPLQALAEFDRIHRRRRELRNRRAILEPISGARIRTNVEPGYIDFERVA